MTDDKDLHPDVQAFLKFWAGRALEEPSKFPIANEAWNTALAHARRWIPVSTPPPWRTDVIGLCTAPSAGQYVEILRCANGCWLDQNGDIHTPTHYQLLPSTEGLE